MNKIYKVIFNRNKNRYEIVSELASSRGKCKVKVGKQIGKLFMTGLLATFLSSVALAADEEVKVKYDAATGTIKIFNADESQVLASYAVGGNISPITSIGTKNPTGIIAMGDQSKAVQSNTIAIGADAHAGNVGGSDDTNGRIAIGTKTVASGDRSIALGNQSTTNKGSYNIAQGSDSIGIGTSTSVFGYSGVSIGRRNIIGIPDPALVSADGVLTTKSKTKYSEDDLGGNSVIVGAYNVAYGNRSNVIGTYSRAMGSNSVAIGSGVQSLSDGSIAIGKGSGYEFEEGSRKGRREKEFYGRDWELPPEYKVLKQVLSTDIAGDKQYEKETGTWENGGTLPKYNNYGAGSSDPGGFIVEGENALGIGTYTQVRGDSAIGLATGEMTADLSKKDKSQYARDMRKIMDMEETLYAAKEALKSGSTSDKATLEANVKTAEESLAAAKKEFRKNYLSKYSFVEGEGALGVGRQILAQGDRSMAVGDYAKAISNDAIAYGGQTLANGTNSMAMGGNAHVGTIDTSFDNSMAIGSHTNVQAGNAVALGAFSQVTGQNSLALGFGKQSGDDITYNSVSGKDSTLIGSYGTVKGNNSILIGSNGNIANDRVVGLGNNINIEAADQNDQENNTAGSVFLGDHAGYVKDSKRSRSLGQVDVVGSAGKMELTESLSSTKGALRDYTKDFIYIYMLERQDDGTQIGAPIAVRSDFAGGDSTVGVVSVGSTYEQKFNSLQDIKDYHSKVGSLITVPVDVTVQVTKNGVPLGEQQQTRYFAADSTRDTIYADNTLSEEDKAKVWDTIQKSISSSNSTYTVFETRRIQNVAPGLIGLNSTDAINGSQLFATNQMLGNLVGSLKKTFGDNVTITEDGQINVSGGTLGWIAKAKAADGSNGTVNYQVGKDDKITKDDLEKKGSAIEAADQLIFQAGKNIGLVQTPDTLTISTIDTPSFKSVELRGDEKTVDGKKVTEVTKIDSSGMKVVTETSTPASDGSTTPTVTEKVSTTVGKDGVSTDGSVKVTNGKDGDQAKEFVTIDKGTDGSGTDKEYGKIGLDGKNGSNATITVDRGTSSLDDTKNIGTDPNRDISKDNPAKMDRITYTTKNKDGNDVITHEVATMDDGLFFSGDSADGKDGNVKNKFDRKLSQETKIIGGVDLGLTDSASAKERQEAIAAKLTDGNIGVISDGTDTLTVKLAKQLTGLDSTTYTSPTTKTGDGDATSTMKVDGNGVRFVSDKDTVKNDAPSLTTDGITGGNKTITDVASGIGGEVKDSSHNANTFLENVNKIGAPTNGISENIVVNAKDLKNLVDTGFKLNTSGQPTDPGASTVKIGDTINVINGVNTKVSAIDDTVNGTHTFHIDVTGMPISYTDTEGNALTKIGDKYYKNTDIENGKPKTDATEVPADKVTNNIKVINKDGTTNNQGTISNVKSVFDSNIGNGADTGSKVDEIKDGSVISNTGSNLFINDLTKLNDQVDPKATDAEAEKIRAKKDEEKLNSVSTVRDLQKVALTPLFFEGDVAQDAQTANTFDRKLSEKTKIVGGQKDVNQLTDNNIGVVSNGTDTLTIKLAKNLVNLTSVETGSGNNKTKMTENGVTTTVKDGDTFKVTTTTPNGLATTEVKLDSDDKPTGESTTTMVTTDGVTITTQTPKNGDKPASTTETKLSKDGLATDGTIKVTGDNAKDLVTIAKGTETDQNATDKEFGTVTIDGKNGSNAILTVDRGTKSVTDSANVGKDSSKPVSDDNQAGMDRLTYTTTGADGKSIINHEVATLDDGFFLTTEHTEADKTRTVLFNNTIKVLDGANTKVSAMGGEKGTHTFSIDVTGLPVSYTVQQDGNTTPENVSKVGDTYQLANGTKLVKVGNKFYKPDQLVNPTVENPTVKQGEENKDWKLTNNVSLVNPNGGKDAPTLSNVGSALKKSDGTRITMSDLDDSSTYPTDNPIWNNAVNVGDLKAATDAARTEVTGTGKAIVTKKTGDKGQNIYNVHVDPIVDVVGADGSEVVRGDDGKYYNPTDIANKTYIPNADGNGGNWYDNGDLTNGVPNQGAKPQTVKTADIKNSIVNPNSNDSIVLDNVKSGIGGKVDDPEHEHKNTFMENVDTIGKANGISENTVVNAGDLKNLVDTGFKLNTSGHSGDAQTVKIGETIKVVDGANTKVSAIDDSTTGTYTFHIDVTGLPVTYTATETDGEGKPTGTPVDVTKTKDGYQKADGTPLIKINENGKDVYYTADQLDNNIPKPGAKGLTITDNIRLINPKDGTGATKITNVAAGTDDTDAVNVSQLKQKVAAATTEVTGTGAAEVTKVTGADGQNVYNVHVDKLMEAKSTEPGKTIVRGSNNKYYYVDDALKQANDGKWYPADQVGADGKPADGAVGKDTTELTVVPADKLKNSLVNPNGNGPTIVDNVKSVLDGSGIGNGADMSSKIDTIENGKPVDTAGSNQFIKDLTGLNPTTDADKLNSVSTVSDLQKVALTPLFFEGDTAESAATNNAFGRKLSQKTKIVGGVTTPANLTDNNIGVVSNGSDTLTIKLAKELQDLTSVTTVDETNGTKTTVSGKGITTDGKVVVNNGKTGDEAKEFVTIDKGTDGSGTDKEYGKIGLDGKNGSNATITIDRGTKSLNDDVNIGVDPSQPVSETNKSATMDRITYTTTGPNKTVINHEVATLDDGFFLTTSKDVTDNKAAAKVKLNNTIKFTDGANTKVSTVESKDGVHELHIDVTGLPMTYTVSQTGGTDAPVSVSKVGDTYQLADGTKLVKVGDKFYKPSQLVDPKADQPQVKPEEVAKDWTVNDSISLVNKDGSNNAPTTLKNVGSGLKDANGNSTTLDQAVGSNAVNVDDLRTLGKAATTEVTGTGAAEVTKVTGADGQNIYNVHVERFMQVAETDVEGNKVVKAADNYYYKEADIKDKTYIDGQWYNNTDIKDKTKIGDKWYSNTEITDGKANPGAKELTVQATTAPNKAVGLQNNLVNPNDNTPTRLSNLASALSGEVGNGANTEDNSAINGIDKNGKPTSESGSNTFVKNVLDLDATEKTVEQLKTSLGHEPSEDEVKAEKARAEKDKALLNSAVTVADLQKTLQSPLFFEGDSADGVANENGSDKNTFARKLSQKTKIVGGVDLGLKENATADERKKAIADKLTDGNIGVISDGSNTLTVKLAKNLVNLTSVETGSGDNKTKMTENGVTITTQTPKNGDKPASTTETKLSKDGLATDGTIKVTGDNAKDLVTIAKGTETDPNATDKEFGTVTIDGKNDSKATLTVDRGTKSVTDKANILKDPKQPAEDNNPVSMDRLTYTTTGADGKSIIKHEVATLDDGFFLTTEHTEEDKTRTVLFNNTIKVLDGANTKVSAMGGKDGTHTFSIDVTGLPVTYTATKTDTNGAPTGDSMDVSKVGDGYQLADGTKLVKAGDKYYTPDQLKNGQPKPDAEGLTIKESVSLTQDNSAPATLERVGSGRRNGMKADADPMVWDKILNPSAEDKAKVDNMLTNAANIGDVRDAIKSITNGTDDNAIGGFGLTGNNGEVKQDLGKTITVKGGIANKKDDSDKDLGQPAKSTTDKNTYVNVKDVPNADGKGSHKEMVIEIAKDLTDLDSVTVGSVDKDGKGETTKITGKDVTIKDKDGNTNKSTASNNKLTNANGDKTTVEAGNVNVSKKDKDGNTNSTNIDGSTITLENKDKDGKTTVGSKTDIGTDGIRITYKDKDGNTDSKKDVSLTDKGLNNGGNQIKNVGSGLVNKDGNKIKDIAGIKDQNILSNGVNVGDLQQAINSVTNSSNGGGFGLKGNNGEIMQNLGETITIKGGIANKKDDSGKDLPAKSTTAQNTYVNMKDSEMVVEIAKDLTDLDSVTIGNVDEKGNGGTVINKDSMTVKDKDGKNSTNIGTGTIGTSKTDGNGNTSSTNIDGSTITLENKGKDGKTVGSKTDIGTDGIKITYKDDKGNVDPKKDVSLTDKGLNNGGNQIKNVGSGLVDKNGKDITDISNIADSDILSNGVNVKDLQSVNKKLKDDIINISNQVDDIKNSAPVVYTDENGKRVSKQGDKFVNEDGIEVKPHKIKLSLVNADGKTTNPSTLQNVAKGVKDTDAVNVKQLKEATEKPLTFNGDTGSSSAKLGETVAIKGGANSADLTDNNIGVIADSTTKTLNVKLSKKLKGLESAEFVDNNGNTTNITGDGVHISGGNGSNVSLTSQGLNNGGNRITNVAPGVEATDAVNVSQLNQVGAALHNRINNVAKGAYGGVASAGAMASLPQAYLPGKSMVAAGASHYRGESAVALGTSRISDNGKIILKLNASHNTSGNTMVGAGVGYQF
ncbi:YadA-like family protein [Gallibacterium anatis]|uniref:YadA-like family protein n=1 Tax=Gallibacterium anatis TaxID=750 RepID=UPI003004AAD9